MSTMKAYHADQIIEPQVDWRRIRDVPVSRKLVEQWVMEGTEFPSCRCIQGLPGGVRLVNAYCDTLRQTLVLQFYHPDFEDVMAQAPPECSPVYRRCDGGTA